MRLPVIGNISTKDGATNKNARLTNMLAEQKKNGTTLATVRPGLNKLATGSGAGNNLVCFNGALINIFGDNIKRASDTLDSNTGSFTPPSGAWSEYTVYDVASNGSIFCAVPAANYPMPYFFTSTDGLNWTARSIPTGVFTSGTYQIIFDGLMFVAVDTDLDKYYLSSDAITWTQYSISNCPISSSLAYFNYCNGLYCFAYSTTSAITSDFTNWAYGTTPYQILNIGATDTAFIGVVFNNNKILRSTNGTSWSAHDLPTTAQWVSIAYNGEAICVVAQNSTTCAVSNDDGVTWHSGTLPSTGYTTISGVDGKFIAVKNSYIATSLDGVVWSETATSFSPHAGYRGGVIGNKFCFCQRSYSFTTLQTMSVDYGITLQDVDTMDAGFCDFAIIP